MKNTFFITYQYLRYRIKAKNEHGVHSPFVFDLLTAVIYNNQHYYAFEQIELNRKVLSLSTEKVNYIDMGAVSTGNAPITKSIKQLLNKSVKPAKYAQLIFKLVNYFQPKTILELGTSLGITTNYMAAANANSTVITIEGIEEIAAIATKNRAKLPYKNITQVIGNFNDILPTVLTTIDKLDFVFFDGNHRKSSTIQYFKQCLTKSHPQSVFVFDDIYWSPEMKEAWEIIKKNEQVTVSIDLFFFGIIFFRKEQVKQHFILKF